MRVLLTGAAGFIGLHVLSTLTDAGHDVVALDALLESVHGPDASPPEGIARADIRDPDALDPLLRGIDVVVHLAAAIPAGSAGGVSSSQLVVPGPPGPPREHNGSAPSTGGTNAVRRDNPNAVRPGSTHAVHPDSVEAVRPGGVDRVRIGGADGVRPSGADGVRPGGADAGRPDKPDAARAGGMDAVRPGNRIAARTGGMNAVRPEGPNVQRAPMFAAHNDFGTAVLLAAMERAGVRRLVLASSVSVYGEGRYRGLRSGPFFPGVRRRADLDRGMFDHRAPRSGEILTWEPVGEDAPLRPRTEYAASKAAQENYAMAWGAATGAGVTVLRYHHVYGDPMHENAALRAHSGVAARFRAELTAGRAPYVFEDGGQVRDFVHVRDIAAATAAVVARPLSGFVPLNIASGHPITLWEVASIMARALGGPNPVVSGQYRITDARHIVADPQRARRTVDFTATIDPVRGLADYAATGAHP